jgi:flagellar motor switch protein FliN
MPVLSESPRPSAATPAPAELSRILHLQVPVIVRLASRRLSLQEVLRLASGAILEFSKRSEEPLELLINNKVIGVGQAVKVGENFGLRLTSIGGVRQKLDAMRRD